MQQGSPQCGGSILCEKESPSDIYCEKYQYCAHGGEYNKLHGNWGEKTLRRSTALFLACCLSLVSL